MKTLTLTAFLTFQLFLAFGQAAIQNTAKWEVKFFNAPEIVLPMLIDAATKNSAEYKKLELSKQIAQEDLKFKRNTILNNVGVGAAYTYGTFINFFNGEQIQGSANAFSQPSQALYNVNLNLRLSLGELVNRRHEINTHKLKIQQSETDQKIGEREIRNTVIEAYNQMSLAKIEWDHAQDMLETAKVNRRISEANFKRGELQINAHMAAMDLYNRTVMAQEQAKNKYVTSVLLLEELIGMTIQDLMNKK